jgi:hypothetical protein
MAFNKTVIGTTYRDVPEPMGLHYALLAQPRRPQPFVAAAAAWPTNYAIRSESDALLAQTMGLSVYASTPSVTSLQHFEDDSEVSYDPALAVALSLLQLSRKVSDPMLAQDSIDTEQYLEQASASLIYELEQYRATPASHSF